MVKVIVGHPEVWSQHDCIKVACVRHPCALEFACEQLRSDSGFVRSVLESEFVSPAEVLQHVSPKLFADPAFMLFALTICPGALAHAPSDLIVDREFMSRAVRQNRLALRALPDHLLQSGRMGRDLLATVWELFSLKIA